MITERDILEAVKVFPWITRREMELYFGGAEKRLKALEVILPKLERDGKLAVMWHKGEKVYSRPRVEIGKPVSLGHEITWTDIYIRFWRCRMGESEIIPERKFRGFGIVPEGGLRYPEELKSMLIFEYCTRANFTHGGVMKSKLTRYQRHLPDIEAKFKRNITVLFVIDIERKKVSEFVGRMNPLLEEPVISGLTSEPRYPFFFTDYRTLKSVPVGDALTAPIYFWNDGKEWRLTNNA